MQRACAILVLLIAASVVVADDKPKVKARNARETLEGWIAAALAGEVDKATPLADPNTSLAAEKGVKKFQKRLGVKALKIPTVYVSEKQGQAAAMSEAVTLTKANPDKRDSGVLSFLLIRVEGKWLLKDIDFDTKERAAVKVKDFPKQYPDAKELPPKPKG